MVILGLFDNYFLSQFSIRYYNYVIESIITKLDNK